MKLIYIANGRIPTEKAHGLQIMEMAEAFSNLVEVELVIPWRFNPIKKDPFEYYGVKRNFKIKKLPCLDLIPLDKYLGHLAFWIESATFFFSVSFYLLFKKANVLYTRDKFLLFFHPFKKNVFFEAHGFSKNYFLYAPYFQKLKGIITITKSLRELFLKEGIAENKLLVAPDGVDLEKFNIKESQEESRRKLNLLLDKKIILYAGHLYEWKGAVTLLRAAKNFQNVLFVFVGGTKKDIESFKFQVSKLKLKNVLVVGHRPHSEIPSWLKVADILVLPSSAKDEREKYFTSPLKLFEYMTSKRPIVASDLPSLREVLNEKNSILVEPDNPKALAEGIKCLLKNPNFSAKISNQAFWDVQKYTWRKRAENILNFISYV